MSQIDEKLIKAAYNGNFDNVVLAIRQGANVNVYSGQPLQNAAFYGNLKIVNYLINHGAKINWPSSTRIITDAIYSKTLPVVKAIIKAGLDVKGKKAALKYAVEKKYLSIIKYLVTPVYKGGAGIDPNSTVPASDSPLMIATSNGDLEIVKILVTAGADIDKQSWTGRTAIDIAMRRHRNIANYLLNAREVKNYKTARNIAYKIQGGPCKVMSLSLPKRRSSLPCATRKVKSLPNKTKPRMARPRKIPLELANLIGSFAGSVVIKHKRRCI